MPLYEYACKACGQHLEVSQSFKDEPLTVCPACGGQLRKVFNSIGISFKGSGFYRTDSRPALRKDKDRDRDKDREGDTAKAGGGKDDKATTAGKDGSSSSTAARDKATKSDSSSRSGDTSKSGATSDAKSA